MTRLFDPFALGPLTLKNRLVVSPMCQYSARSGVPNDWHLVHLGRFALGGFGLVIAEASAVVPEGRITYRDTGLWSDAQIGPWRRITDFLRAQGAASGIQIAHAGRKAASPVPWRGSFNETDAEKAELGFEDWTPHAPSAQEHGPGFKMPHALDTGEIAQTVKAFGEAAKRAASAGFDLAEIHGAHGYLINQFLSPLANSRTDSYGGSAENRMRFPLEVVEAVRANWPKDRPLIIRISATDAHPEGLTTDDLAAFAKQAAEIGVDLIDCSSGGFAGAGFQPAPNYQVPLAAEIKRLTGLPTMAVGLITTPQDAARVVDEGHADLVALGRPALAEPNFPLHARKALGVAPGDYSAWPDQAGWGIRNMDRSLERA